jgi:hypothetical protein
MFRFIAAALLTTTVLLTGCASGLKMPLQDDAPLAASAKPLLLLSVDMKNAYRERFQPLVRAVHVTRQVGGKEELIAFSMDSKGSYWGEKEDQPARHMVRLELEPGQYQLRGVLATASAFPFTASYYLPLLLPLTVTDSRVTYLGNINATVRERQGDEFKAGPSIPLLDQTAAGASGGTFDVQISDAATADLALFTKLFPALKAVEVNTSLLPAFDRARAQAWWEAN